MYYLNKRLINIYENYLKTKYDKNDINIIIVPNNNFLLLWINQKLIIEIELFMFKIRNPYTRLIYKIYDYTTKNIEYYNIKNCWISIFKNTKKCIYKHIKYIKYNYNYIHKIYKNNILIKNYLYNRRCFYKYYYIYEFKYEFKYIIYISKFCYHDLFDKFYKYIKIYKLYNIIY